MPEITLTHQDRQFLLKHISDLSESPLQALVVNSARYGILHLRLSHAALEQICGALLVECQTASSRKVRRVFERLSKRFETLLSKSESDDIPAPPSVGIPAWMRDEVERLLNTEPSASMEDINRKLQDLSDKHNRRSREEFGGLSPNQVKNLLDADLESKDSAVVLNQRIPASELAEIEIFANARLMLQALIDAGGTKATTAGNLNRKFVDEMLRQVQSLEDFVKNLRKWNKVINEDDFAPICVLRHVMQFGGLLCRTKGMFHATKKAEGLMAAEKAGDMYSLLFRSFFEKFNLASLDHMPECNTLQDTLAFSFLMIGKHAGDWISPKDLARHAILPAALAEIPPSPYSGESYAPEMLTTRVIRPLLRFGLLECKYEDDAGIFLFRDIGMVRKTSLFDAFLSFDLSER